MVHPGNLVRANDTTPLVVINQIKPINVTVRRARGAAARAEAVPGEGSRARRGGGAQRGRARRPKAASRFVDNAVDPTTGTIRVKGSFPNGDARLWPGQFVNVMMTLATDPDAHRRAVTAPCRRASRALRVRGQAGPHGGDAHRRGRSHSRRRDTLVVKRRDGRRNGRDRRPAAAGARHPRRRSRAQAGAGGGAMNPSALFIKRPVTTILLMLGILVFGTLAYRQLPVQRPADRRLPHHPGQRVASRREPRHRRLVGRAAARKAVRDDRGAAARSTRPARRAAPTSRCSST